MFFGKGGYLPNYAEKYATKRIKRANMDKQEFISKVTSVAEVVCGNEYLFGVVEFSDTRKYIAFAAEGATLNTPQQGIHKSEELFGETSAKDMAWKLLEHIDLSKVSRIYETC